MTQEMKKQMIQAVSENKFIRNMGIELTELEKGYAKGRMKVVEEVLNPYGSVHGGCLYSLADTVAGVAAGSYGKWALTVNGSMNFLNPALHTDYVFCEAKVVRQGKQLAVYDVTLFDDQETVLENGSFTFYIMNKECIY